MQSPHNPTSNSKPDPPNAYPRGTHDFLLPHPQVGKPKRTDRVLLPAGLEERVIALTRDAVEAAYRWVELD
jgi:hypothetical protein